MRFRRPRAAAAVLVASLGLSACELDVYSFPLPGGPDTGDDPITVTAQFADVLVNCTPVGMHPNVNEPPFQPQWLGDNTLVFDTVYNPENTLLIKQARERGCPTVSGIEMFIRQAALQYQHFTAQPAPLDVMRDTLRHAISAVR